MGTDIKSNKTVLPDQGVLFSKLNPRINRVWIFRKTKSAQRIASTEFVCLIPNESHLDLEYLGWRLRVPTILQELPVATAAATKSRERIKPRSLLSLQIPLPPLAEQRRIVGILNRAARIERLRNQAQELMREFIPALFVKMFGDPATNPMEWNLYPFLDLVSDGTKKCIKIQKRDYRFHGLVQIIDQGRSQVGGYTDRAEGAFDGPFPSVVFGDHTRRFKLIEEPFFLGADGVKLLEPKTSLLDPVFLFGQCQTLDIKDAGYSRHYRFLKMTQLVLPPLDKQRAFAALVSQAYGMTGKDGLATKIATALSGSLISRLLRERA